MKNLFRIGFAVLAIILISTACFIGCGPGGKAPKATNSHAVDTQKIDSTAADSAKINGDSTQIKH